MYYVSDEYRAAMAGAVQRHALEGTIGVGGKTYKFTGDNVVSGTFSISGQCSGSENVEIGTVYTSELEAVFCGLELPKGSLSGAVIEPWHGLLVGDGYEWIRLGVFYVQEANWTAQGVSVTAYDGMSLFEKSFSLDSSNGTVWQFINLACERCKLTFGMDEDEVAALPNGEEVLGIYSENDMETWRDLVAWCAQSTGTFAAADRDGFIRLYKYGTEAVNEIDASGRLYGGKISDFVTRYTGMSIVNIQEQTTTYYGLELDDGLTYNLGSNPLLQYGLPEVLIRQRRAVLGALAEIRGTPMELSLFCPPVYDLGDRLRFTGGLAGEGVDGYVTAFDWKFNGEYSIKGVGQNPALASARSKVDKNISGLISRVDGEGGGAKYYDYFNIVQYQIADGSRQQIISFNYVTESSTHVTFHGEVKFTAEKDTWLYLTYYICGTEVEYYHPEETVTAGVHTLHLMFTWQSGADVIGTFTVWLHPEGGKVTVYKDDARAYLMGNGFAGEPDWNGQIDARDTLDGVDIAHGVVLDFTDAAQAALPPEERPLVGDSISGVDIAHGVGLSFVSDGGLFITHRFTSLEGWNYSADEVTVTDGVFAPASGLNGAWMRSDAVQVAAGITKATVVDEGGVLYTVSFDGGTTWMRWNQDAGEWTEAGTVGMLARVFTGITAERWAEMPTEEVMVRVWMPEGSKFTEVCLYEG